MHNEGKFSKCHKYGCSHSDKNPGAIEIELSSQHNQERQRARGQSIHSRFTCARVHAHTLTHSLTLSPAIWELGTGRGTWDRQWPRHTVPASWSLHSHSNGEREAMSQHTALLCVQRIGVSGQKQGVVVKETGRPAAGMRPTHSILQSQKVSPGRWRYKVEGGEEVPLPSLRFTSAVPLPQSSPPTVTTSSPGTFIALSDYLSCIQHCPS